MNKMKIGRDRDATSAAPFLERSRLPRNATKLSGVVPPGANRPCAIRRRQRQLTSPGSQSRFRVLLLWQKRDHLSPRDRRAQIASGCAPRVRSGESHWPIVQPTFSDLQACANFLARSRQSLRSLSLSRERTHFHALLLEPRPASRLLNCALYPNPSRRGTNDNNVACAPPSHSAPNLKRFHLR